MDTETQIDQDYKDFEDARRSIKGIAFFSLIMAIGVVGLFMIGNCASPSENWGGIARETGRIVGK
jgi:hypothetical protein